MKDHAGGTSELLRYRANTTSFFPDLLIPKAITVKHLLTMSSGLPDYPTELFLNFNLPCS
jgi:CubicO group peptidase (beta-lactamase class C family)